MAAKTSLRLRRLVDRQTEIKQQLITFQLRQTGFLLPIQAVARAVTFPTWESESTITYADQTLPVINVTRQIFGQESRDRPLPSLPIGLIVRNQQGQLACLPIDSAPSLCRIPQSSFVPLPKTYQVKCVRQITSSTAEQPLLFLLDSDALIQ